MEREDILERSKILKESGEFIKSDFWIQYTRRLLEKKKIKENDCVNLEDVKLYKAQGAAKILHWALFDLPTDILREMGKSSDESEHPK